jgi:hypothetical protein
MVNGPDACLRRFISRGSKPAEFWMKKVPSRALHRFGGE